MPLRVPRERFDVVLPVGFDLDPHLADELALATLRHLHLRSVRLVHDHLAPTGLDQEHLLGPGALFDEEVPRLELARG